MAFKVTGYEETLTGNGQTQEVPMVGPVHVHISGTWDGGLAVVQMKDANGTFHDIAETSYTTNVDKLIQFPSNVHNILRISLSGAGSPSLKTILQGSSRLLTS